VGSQIPHANESVTPRLEAKIRVDKKLSFTINSVAIKRHLFGGDPA
jgi:hypothetical protein